MAKLYSYIRWSSDKQTKGSSLERQLKYAQEVAINNNLELVEILDASISAFKGKNIQSGALGEFLEAVKAGVIQQGSWLVIENLDRLSRQQILDAQALFMNLLTAGITIVTGMDSKTYNKESVTENPMDLMYSIMLFARAHEESKTKSNRTNNSAFIAINKFNNGIRSKDGYALPVKAVGSHPWMFDTANGDVREHPYFFNIAKDIVNKLLSGMGSYKLKEYLDANYNPPKKRKNKKRDGWAINLLRNFHKQDYIRGIKKITIAGIEHTLDGYYPKLVDDTTFFKLQNIRKKNRVTTTSKTYVGLISGIRVAKCGHCSDSISFFTNRKTRNNKQIGKPEPYNTLRYICTNKQISTRNCSSGSVDAQRIEDAIIRIGLAKIWSNDEKNDSGQPIELEAKKSQLKEQETQAINFASNMARMESVPDFILKQGIEIDIKLKTIEKEIKELENKAINNTTINITDIEKQWNSIPPNVLAKENDRLRTKVRGMIRDSIESITIWKLDGSERAGNKVEIKFKDGDLLSFDRTPTKLTLIDGFFDDSSPETLFNRFKNLVSWNMEESEYSHHSPKKIVRNLKALGEVQFYPLIQPLE